jgi:hypothetical protein
MFKPRSTFLTLLLSVLVVAGPVSARPPRGDGPPPMAQGMVMMPGGGEPVAFPRERRLQWLNERGDAGAVPPDRPRMTREERMELRREINDAGRELYPRRRHH